MREREEGKIPLTSVNNQIIYKKMPRNAELQTSQLTIDQHQE